MDKVLQSEIENIIRSEYTECGIGCTNIAKHLQERFPNEHITHNAWESRVKRFVNREGLKRHSILIPYSQDNNQDTQNGYKQNSIERKADGSYIYDSIIEIMENEVITPERMMEAHKLNPQEWEVVSYKNNLSPVISINLAESSPEIPGSPFCTCNCHLMLFTLGSLAITLFSMHIHKLPL